MNPSSWKTVQATPASTPKQTLENRHGSFLKTVNSSVSFSNKLPVNEDYELYRLYPKVNEFLISRSNKVQNLMNKILANSGSTHKSVAPANITKLTKSTVDDYLEKLTEINDDLQKSLENHTNNARTANIKSSKSEDLINSIAEKITNSQESAKIVVKTFDKPQKGFLDKVDNSMHRFLPRITKKPHSLQPLSETIVSLYNCTPEFPDQYAAKLMSDCKTGLKPAVSRHFFRGRFMKHIILNS